jgi:hypothetical protein
MDRGIEVAVILSQFPADAFFDIENKPAIIEAEQVGWLRFLLFNRRGRLCLGFDLIACPHIVARNCEQACREKTDTTQTYEEWVRM